MAEEGDISGRKNMRRRRNRIVQANIVPAGEPGEATVAGGGQKGARNELCGVTTGQFFSFFDV